MLMEVGQPWMRVAKLDLIDVKLALFGALLIGVPRSFGHKLG